MRGASGAVRDSWVGSRVKKGLNKGGRSKGACDVEGGGSMSVGTRQKAVAVSDGRDESGGSVKPRLDARKKRLGERGLGAAMRVEGPNRVSSKGMQDSVA